MKKSHVILLLGMMLLTYSCARLSKTPPPNIVLIFIDDMGWWQSVKESAESKIFIP